MNNALDQGLTIPCQRMPGAERDGFGVRFDMHFLNGEDRLKIAMWLNRLLRNIGGF
jgi:hypothetical protein